MTMEKDCQQCLELLPWYVNGSLQPTQAQQVFQHLAQCPQCAEQEKFLSGLQQHVREHEVETPAPAWNKLHRRLEPEARGGMPWWKRGFVPAVAMAAIVVVVAVRMPSPAGKAEYRLMTSSTSTTHPDASAAHHAVHDETALLRILLASGTNQDGAAQLFSSFDADIVVGPTPRGVYTVALRHEIADRDAFIASLRTNSQIEFVEWVETH